LNELPNRHAWRAQLSKLWDFRLASGNAHRTN
jgi:hypothetical protein